MLMNECPMLHNFGHSFMLMNECPKLCSIDGMFLYFMRSDHPNGILVGLATALDAILCLWRAPGSPALLTRLAVE